MRYYDPGTGRYTQVDPIGFEAGDENLYRYVRNNSTSISDPEGLIAPQIIGGIVGAAFGMYSAHKAHTSMLQGLLIGGITGVASTLPIPGLGAFASGIITGVAAGGIGNVVLSPTINQRLIPT
jgi:uncharacterized protein RhaS with RHS repeats